MQELDVAVASRVDQLLTQLGAIRVHLSLEGPPVFVVVKAGRLHLRRVDVRRLGVHLRLTVHSSPTRRRGAQRRVALKRVVNLGWREAPATGVHSVGAIGTCLHRRSELSP